MVVAADGQAHLQVVADAMVDLVVVVPALQDAVATANVIAAPLAAGTLREHHLARVQRRRAPAVRLMQPIQLMLHRVIARPGGGAMIPNPLPRRVRVALVVLLPLVRRVAARVVGRGFVPERIRAELLKN